VVGDDEVEGVVEKGIALGAAVIIEDRFAQTLTLHLGSEGHKRRRSAARAGAALEAVGHHRIVPGRLIEMAMRVHAAGQHKEASSLDLPSARGQVGGERRNPAVAHADVSAEDIDRRHRCPASDDQVELCHIGSSCHS
jgi:hypothetical protein